MKQITLLTLLLVSGNLFAQVTNEVDVFVKPGTEVYVLGNVTNTSTGDFEVGSEGLLDVGGTLVNNGSMTFNNSASLLRGSTGSDGTGSGTYFVKRQGTTIGTVFNYWSSPMTGFSGVPGSNGYFYNPNLGTQDFSDDQPADPGWISHGGAMTPGAGYAGQGGGLAVFNGDVNNGNVNIPLTYYPFAPGNTSAGTPFNLVGNPYPSAVSCASLVAGNPDINGSIYFWDDDLTGGSGYSSSDYAIWNGTGSLGTGSGLAGAPNGYISTGQGFKVRALNGSAVLNFSNTMRTANNTQFFRADGDNSRMWFSIQGNNFFNQILLGVLTDATDGEDRLYDAVKFRGTSSISLSAVNAEIDYSILAFPPPPSEKSIPLSVYVSENGVYTFKADVMENFEFQNVYFVDSETMQYVHVYEGIEIHVSLEEGEYENRFYLNFYPDGFVGIPEESDDSVVIYSANDQLYLSSNEATVSDASLKIFDVNGRLILQNDGLGISSSTTVVSLAGLSTGVYFVQLLSHDGFVNKKIVKH